MKRYGQRVITLKDMLVEYLMAHMEGTSFKQLKEELGASEIGLRRVLAEMEGAGELLRITQRLLDLEHFEPPGWSVAHSIVFKLSPRMWIEEAAGI